MPSSLVHAATKISRPTIYAGITEIQSKGFRKRSGSRVRKKGGGAKFISSKNPGVVSALESLVETSTKGDPETPLQWTNKGVTHLSLCSA